MSAAELSELKVEVHDYEYNILDRRPRSAPCRATRWGPDTIKHQNITPMTSSMEPTVHKSLRNIIIKKLFIQNKFMYLFHFIESQNSQIMLEVLNIDKSLKNLFSLLNYAILAQAKKTCTCLSVLWYCNNMKFDINCIWWKKLKSGSKVASYMYMYTK